MMIELGLLLGVIGALIGIATFAQRLKVDWENKAKKDTEHHIEMRTRLSGIEAGVEDMRIRLRTNEASNNELKVEVAAIREVARSAHRRIDALEKERS